MLQCLVLIHNLLSCFLVWGNQRCVAAVPRRLLHATNYRNARWKGLTAAQNSDLSKIYLYAYNMWIPCIVYMYLNGIYDREALHRPSVVCPPPHPHPKCPFVVRSRSKYTSVPFGQVPCTLLVPASIEELWRTTIAIGFIASYRECFFTREIATKRSEEGRCLCNNAKSSFALGLYSSLLRWLLVWHTA